MQVTVYTYDVDVQGAQQAFRPTVGCPESLES